MYQCSNSEKLAPTPSVISITFEQRDGKLFVAITFRSDVVTLQDDTYLKFKFSCVTVWPLNLAGRFRVTLRFETWIPVPNE